MKMWYFWVSYPLMLYSKFYDSENEIRAENKIENIYSLCGVEKDGKYFQIKSAFCTQRILSFRMVNLKQQNRIGMKFKYLYDLRSKMGIRAYIDEFFKFYNYEEEDSKFLIDSYEKIMDNSVTFALFNQAMDLYNESIDCDYGKIIDIADKIASILYLYDFTVEFLIFVCLSQRAEKVYAAKGIPSEIFHANMYDLKYKADECKLVYNIVGSFVADWFIGFFKATRFTFGRLQFELMDFCKNYENDGKVLTPESKVINIHIPRSLKPLDEKSCDEAFFMAKEFFKDEFESYIPFYCNSWILYPENKKILSEKSNTYRFMSGFEIINEYTDKNLDNLWRIFDTMERCPDKLPEKTLLQKAYKAHLKNGGKLGGGEGLFFISL